MRILVISKTVWSRENSFGNSYNNIFRGIKDLEFANVFCRQGRPDCDVNLTRCFYIDQSKFIPNLFNRKIATGHELVLNLQSKVISDNKISSHQLKEKKALHDWVIRLGKILRWQVFKWMEDLHWKIGRWNSPELEKFIKDFQPDLLFMPVYYAMYMNDIVLWVKKLTNAPMLGYISDDNYTLRQFSLSPLFWIDRLWKRRKVKAVIDKCEILYVISVIQKREYNQIFGEKCKVLTKMDDFDSPPPSWNYQHRPLSLIYAGNIGTGRWKSLALLAKAVERLNHEGMECNLDIYTSTPLSLWMRHALLRHGTVFHSPVSYYQIIQLQKETDILVHVEGLSFASRLAVHQSFSTKLVDFFAMGKPILAIGTPDVASISYLIENKAAMVVSDEQTIYKKLKDIIENKKILIDYGQKSYECGKKLHNRKEIQTLLKNDFRSILSSI